MAPLLIIAVMLASPGHSGHGSGDVRSIDSACAAPARHAGAIKTRFFVETSGAVLPKPREGQWRELETEAALLALSEGKQPPNTEAIVRTTRGGTLVSMYFQDSSVTWAHVVDYCFRAAGPLARLRGTFNSLPAAGAGPGIRRRRTIYYGADGAVLQSKTGVFDLDSDRPLQKVQFLDEEEPLYPSVRALPFSSELMPPVAAVDPDPDGIAATVRERLPSVKACWERAVKAKPGLAGKAVGRWTVDAAGKVTDFSWPSDDIKSAVFGTCARKVIESWRFPSRAQPATVSFPFIFGALSTEVVAR